MRFFAPVLAILLLVTLAGAGACGHGDDAATSATSTTGSTDPLHVLKSEMISGRAMRLVLDAPLASPRPGESSAFRLSVGFRVARGDYFRHCSDLDEEHGVEILDSCPAECEEDLRKECPDASQCCKVTFESASVVHHPLDGFVSVRRGDRDDELILGLDDGPPADACGALFLHFLPRSPTEEVRAVDGRTLDAFGSTQIAGGSEDGTIILPDDGGDGSLSVGTAVLAPLCAGRGCTDGSLDGNETDVDCGGSYLTGCDGCAEGKRCVRDDDCASSACRAHGSDLLCAPAGTPP